MSWKKSCLTLVCLLHLLQDHQHPKKHGKFPSYLNAWRACMMRNTNNWDLMSWLLHLWLFLKVASLCYLKKHYSWRHQQGYNICLLCGMSIGLVGLQLPNSMLQVGLALIHPHAHSWDSWWGTNQSTPVLFLHLTGESRMKRLQECITLKELQHSMRALNIVRQGFMLTLSFLTLVPLLMDSFAVNVVEKAQ